MDHFALANMGKPSVSKVGISRILLVDVDEIEASDFIFEDLAFSLDVLDRLEVDLALLVRRLALGLT